MPGSERHRDDAFFLLLLLFLLLSSFQNPKKTESEMLNFHNGKFEISISTRIFYTLQQPGASFYKRTTHMNVLMH